MKPDLPQSGLQMELRPGQAVTVGPDVTLFLRRTLPGRAHLVIRAPKHIEISRSKAVLALHSGEKPIKIVRETTEEITLQTAPARRAD